MSKKKTIVVKSILNLIGNIIISLLGTPSKVFTSRDNINFINK